MPLVSIRVGSIAFNVANKIHQDQASLVTLSQQEIDCGRKRETD